MIINNEELIFYCWLNPCFHFSFNKIAIQHWVCFSFLFKLKITFFILIFIIFNLCDLFGDFFVQLSLNRILSIFFNNTIYSFLLMIIDFKSREEKDQLIQLSLERLILILKIQKLVNWTEWKPQHSRIFPCLFRMGETKDFIEWKMN